jgi:hypothetical protein
VWKLTCAFRCYANEPKITVFATFLRHLAKNLQVLTLTVLSFLLFKARFPSQMTFNAEQKNTAYDMLAFGSNRLTLLGLLSHKLFFLP